jgi:hypothetical protein
MFLQNSEEISDLQIVRRSPQFWGVLREADKSQM